MSKKITRIANPSLALIKYWGKEKASHKNVPATTSIAVSLDSLESKVTICEADKNTFLLEGEIQSFDIIQTLCNAIKKETHTHEIPFLHIEAENNFPTAAGLASSSSGYAALSQALVDFLDIKKTKQEISAVARIGSGSACRAVYGGFTIWRKGSLFAEELFSYDYWQNFSIIVCAPSLEKKNISSREAMTQTALTSPYYTTWCTYNETLVNDTISAIEKKDIEKLGTLAQQSYSAMHASALAATPPILYWKKESIALLEFAKAMRTQGVPVWETMDAGPQVKLITENTYTTKIEKELKEQFPNLWIRVCGVGRGLI